MNCVDITLLCVFKKSLSNIYVAFFFKRLECVSASGRTHITLLSHLRNRPKTYAFAVANRNKKTINYKFIWRKVFIKNSVRQKKKLTTAILTHTKPSFKIIRENILLSESQKEKHRSKNSLYYTEKNPCFVRVFCKILYTLFTFNFTIAKNAPL